MNRGNFERTEQGNGLLKIVKSLQRFKEKYPKKISNALEFVGIYDDKAIKRILNKIVKGSKFYPLIQSNLRTEKEIRARISSLNKKLRKKVDVSTQKKLEKHGIKGMMFLSERYALWWVLKEVRKHQGRKYGKTK